MTARTAARRAAGTSGPGGYAGPATGAAAVDVGNAGTVLRFVPPVAALTRADVEFRGDDRAAARPVGPLLAALRELGAIIDDGGRGAVPFLVRGRGGVRGGTVTLDASGSSQLVSGLLLAAPRYGKGAEIRHEGARVPSAPHIAMTVQMLRDAGAEVETGNRGRGSGPRNSVPDFWRVHPGELRPARVAVEPDLSNAAPFLAAALVTGGAGHDRGLAGADHAARGADPGRADPDGRRVHAGRRRAAGDRDRHDPRPHRGPGRHQRAAPVLTALAALADSPSVFTGIGHLRRHESDRLAALAGEIGGLGGDVTELRGRPARSGPGRCAAAGLVRQPRRSPAGDGRRRARAGRARRLRVADAATVGKTFPGFTALWAAMLERA